MRQFITYVVMAAVLGIASMGYADDKAAGQKNTTPIKIEKAQKSPITVQKTDTGARAIYVPKGKSVGAYAEGGGSQPSHFNPKGEKRAGGGVAIKFGGSSDKKKNGSK